MYKNFFLPIQIFLILEKNDINFFYSKTSKYKNFFFVFNLNYLNLGINILKYELFSNKSTLLEASTIDLKKYNIKNFFNKKFFILYYIFFNYYNNCHYIFLSFLNKNTSTKSIDLIYKNSNWLERELSEMYGIIIYNKKDLRKLLLDYSKNENPMLKDFPCEGISDVYYNFFDSQINYIQNEIVEL